MTEYALELDDTAVRRFVAAARLAEQAERDEWADAGITAGAAVADVGCGPGAVTALLGQRVAPGGRVAGIDSNPAALAAARRLAGDSGAANVSFSQGDAASTGLAPGSFDVVMLRHVLGSRRELLLEARAGAPLQPRRGHNRCGALRVLDRVVHGDLGNVAVIADRKIGRGHGDSDRAVEVGHGSWIARQGRRGFRKPVAFRDAAAGQLLPLIRDRALHRHAAAV